MSDVHEFDVALELTSDNSGVLRVSGEFDLGTKERFEQAAEDARALEILVIDLSGCTFLDSAALHALAKAALTMRETGSDVSIFAPSSGILRVLEIAALDKVVPVRQTLEGSL